MPSTPSQHEHQRVLPVTLSPRVLRVFRWYTRRLFGKKFHAVRVVSDTIDTLHKVDAAEHPALVLMNHASWWDPLVGVLLADTYLPHRTCFAPMDRAQLERFAFMRKLGIFGIDPDDPDSEPAMRAYVSTLFAQHTQPTLWITPQGRFTDVREPISLRPGSASIAARTQLSHVVCVAIEYNFWQDQRPEVFLRFASCEAERATTASWQRSMTITMQANQDELSTLVRKRDPEPFTCLIGGDAARINPVYDLWLRLRGKRGSIEATRTPRSSDTSSLSPKHAP
jgi:hypothetical protein